MPSHAGLIPIVRKCKLWLQQRNTKCVQTMTSALAPVMKTFHQEDKPMYHLKEMRYTGEKMIENSLSRSLFPKDCPWATLCIVISTNVSLSLKLDHNTLVLSAPKIQNCIVPCSSSDQDVKLLCSTEAYYIHWVPSWIPHHFPLWLQRKTTNAKLLATTISYRCSAPSTCKYLILCSAFRFYSVRFIYTATDQFKENFGLLFIAQMSVRSPLIYL